MRFNKRNFFQGKSNSQLKSSYIGAFVGFIGLCVMGIIYLLIKLFN
jgi:hypothetical protein